MGAKSSAAHKGSKALSLDESENHRLGNIQDPELRSLGGEKNSTRVGGGEEDPPATVDNSPHPLEDKDVLRKLEKWQKELEEEVFPRKATGPYLS